MDIEKSDLLKETMNFVENIEFSEFQPKTEIKEEEGLDQKVWKFSPFDVKPKLEQVEASEIGEAKVKSEPEKFFSNNQMDNLHNESIDIKDEFMWTMKNFVDDNVPPKNIEQQIVAVPEKKPTVIFTVKEGENNPRKNSALQKRKYRFKNISGLQENEKPFKCCLCPYTFAKKDRLTEHIDDVHESKNTFECSLCPFKVARKGQLNQLDRHIAAVHEKKKPFECSFCPAKFGWKCQLKKHIDIVHENKKPFVCSMCPSKFARKGQLTKHIAAAHENEKVFESSLPFECSFCPYKFGWECQLKKHVDIVHDIRKPFVCSMCPSKFAHFN